MSKNLLRSLLCSLLSQVFVLSAFSLFSTQSATAAGSGARGRLFHPSLGGGQKVCIAGLNVSIWQPAASGSMSGSAPVPLVIFSHGFRGQPAQSVFLMKALSQAGYLVVAPDHRDSLARGLPRKQLSFFKVDDWTPNTYKDREEDIKLLVRALQADPQWSSKIDWTKVALIGHSLGGYTVLGLAGAWPSWKMPGVKAVVALAPYTNPFLRRDTLRNIDVPVMYQSGTRDKWINPFVKCQQGAFWKTPSPAVCVEFTRANHFAWTDFNSNGQQEELIAHYCIEFLNKYVRASQAAKPEVQLAGVTSLQAK